MPAGIDPNHISILKALCGFSDYVDTPSVHKSAFQHRTTPSLEGAGRRLSTLSKKGWVGRVMRDGRPKWKITDAGRAALAST